MGHYIHSDTVSIIIYTVIFVKGIFSIKVSYAVAAVIVMLATVLSESI